MAELRLIIWVTILSIACAGRAFGQQSSVSQTVAIQPKSLPADAATVDQFRDYLQLSGVGEVWRTGWIHAVDLNRDKGAPYWPEAFWTDLKDEMRKTDLAPVVWSVYAGVFSKDTMQSVNATLRVEGIQGVTSTDFGKKFCADWAAKEEAGRTAIFALTQSTVERVYGTHKEEIKQARGKYLQEHPDYKD